MFEPYELIPYHREGEILPTHLQQHFDEFLEKFNEAWDVREYEQHHHQWQSGKFEDLQVWISHDVGKLGKGLDPVDALALADHVMEYIRRFEINIWYQRMNKFEGDYNQDPYDGFESYEAKNAFFEVLTETAWLTYKHYSEHWGRQASYPTMYCLVTDHQDIDGPVVGRFDTLERAQEALALYDEFFNVHKYDKGEEKTKFWLEASVVDAAIPMMELLIKQAKVISNK